MNSNTRLNEFTVTYIHLYVIICSPFLLSIYWRYMQNIHGMNHAPISLASFSSHIALHRNFTQINWLQFYVKLGSNNTGPPTLTLPYPGCCLFTISLLFHRLQIAANSVVLCETTAWGRRWNTARVFFCSFRQTFTSHAFNTWKQAGARTHRTIRYCEARKLCKTLQLLVSPHSTHTSVTTSTFFHN